MNEQTFLEQSGMPELAASVIEQCGGWDEFIAIADDVCSHGADGGFNGWIYYRETSEFSRKNLPAIRSHLRDCADSLGETIIGLLMTFRCLQGEDITQDDVGETLWGNGEGGWANNILNALAWFALEEVCREYCEQSHYAES